MLTDVRADTTTLTVKVQNSTSDTTTTTYTKATDISQLSKNSTVYFIQETESGRFQIYFGDGATSKALSDGNIVELSYVITNKTASNCIIFRKNRSNRHCYKHFSYNSCKCKWWCRG